MIDVHALHWSAFTVCCFMSAKTVSQTMRQRPPCCALCRPVHRGGELSITYGMSKDNAILARDYGFVLPGNVQDRIPWQILRAAEQQKAVQAATSGTKTVPGPVLV